MKIKLTNTTTIINLSHNLDTIKVREHFKQYLENISQMIKDEKLMDWELEIWCNYTKSDNIKVFKSTKPYIQDKRKEIFIHIPIPPKEVIEWGIEQSQFTTVVHPEGIEKYYTGVDVDFYESKSLLEHAVSCIEKGILFAFSDGITIAGTKVKIKNINSPT
ncbi:Imm9 family immunity protein [Xanthocytophaga agilis]|uniref:Imm9 family immunity protein n=1 Tax=Xanthocytophaga agilis TaxID=3048010 RepID=A0AAE3R5P2_9BACT|nr:Imm9 family immunity protein [Xanthocytophaga agilis]MDJ1502077.1 Imm9 family immunity protein [Xanthocytophaga agilis]